MNIKLVLKGILLWFTAIVTVFWLLSISNMIETNRFEWIIISTTSMIIINYIFYHTISYRELLTLSLYKYMTTYLNIKQFISLLT